MVVLWCCKGTLKIVVELPVFYWLQFAVWPQAQDSNSHIFGVRRTDQAVWRVDETMELVKVLEPNLPTPAAFKEMHIELLWIWRIVFILFLCILMVVIGLHLVCFLVLLNKPWNYIIKILHQRIAHLGSHLVRLFVILKNPWSDIIRKFCLKEWPIALHYVKNLLLLQYKKLGLWIFQCILFIIWIFY